VKFFVCWFWLAFSLTGTTLSAQPPPFLSSPHLADYDAELRQADGHVDTDAMVQRLQELGVNTYYWLVWHGVHDWDDLKLFLPKAQRARIAVWVYLVPPSEGTPTRDPASEPFKLDYLRWAEEIARLSLHDTNLTGWVIDDFYENHQLFSPDYVRRMQATAKAINPKLAFLPLMYYPELTARFVDDYHNVIDGVVAAYPTDREEINEARATLNGAPAPSFPSFTCPWNTPTATGDYVSASVAASVVSTNLSPLSFAEQDDFSGATAGYHFKQLLIDDRIVWEEDVAGGTRAWHEVTLDLAPALQRKSHVTVTFRLLDKKGVSNFGVRWRLKNLKADGLTLAAGLNDPPRWRVDRHGPFETGFGNRNKPDPGRPVHIPFIVMTAASADEFKLRHGEPASPERIAEWVRFSLQACADGQCDGVVTYCLDKEPQSPAFPLVQKAFHDYNKSGSKEPAN